MRQTILHSITDIVAVAAADVMDMEKEKGKDKDGREIRSAEPLRFAVPGSGRVATKFRPAFVARTWLGQIRFSGKSGGRKERWAIRPKADAQSGR